MKKGQTRENPAVWLENIIKAFVKESPWNSLKNADGDPAWEEPLIGFSNGADPLFRFFKEDIGSFYWTPEEIFNLTYPDSGFSDVDLTVVSWVLPQTEKTREMNRREIFFPAEAWGRSRLFGEEFNVKLADYVVAVLNNAGHEAVAPSRSPLWSGNYESEQYGMSSNWSERHAAYVCGLGTFGLCGGLITPRGKAVRLGSAVTRLRIIPTPRNYRGRFDYCMFLSKGKCGMCIERCPAGAVTIVGHSKKKCRKYLELVSSHFRNRFGFESYGCGLCQTGVPCESCIP